jgi:hypothetical protein
LKAKLWLAAFAAEKYPRDLVAHRFAVHIGRRQVQVEVHGIGYGVLLKGSLPGSRKDAV